MRATPYLDELLGRKPEAVNLHCSKCQSTGNFFMRHVAAVKPLKLWRWTLIRGEPEHMVIICGGCGYRFTAAVGRYRARSTDA